MALRAHEPDENVAEGAPRYGEAAGIEHHPQITDFLPRRYGTILLLALLGVLSTAAAVAFDWFAPSWIARLGLADVAAPAFGAADGMAAWLSAVLFLLTALGCLVIRFLRRHRIDDIRGRYRVWLAAAAACLILSADSVAPLHSLFAAMATHVTQHGALRDHAAWWLAIAGLPLCWIAARTIVDAFESRLAAFGLVASFVCYTLSLVSYLTSWPVASPAGEMAVTSGGRLLGTWMLLVGVVAYGRYVVLDVQGLIVKERRRPRRPKAKASEKEGMSSKSALAGRTGEGHRVSETGGGTPTHSIRSFRQNLSVSRQAAEDQVSQTRWVDGSEPESDDFDDDGPNRGDSKLSKSERKRLRKLKAQHRAA
jgi:hypothetical protein